MGDDAEYEWAHEDEIDLTVTIDWSKPLTHDMLYCGLAESDDSAYLYAIIGLIEREWCPYYIGMVYSQQISCRHKNQDHVKRLDRLKKLYPDTVWHLTLGIPTVDGKRTTKQLIEKVEGLMIYSHWHEDSINQSKINWFFCNRYVSIVSVWDFPIHSIVKLVWHIRL